MLDVGEVIENTQSGERVKIRTGRLDTNGELVEGDFLLRAGGAVAATHIHPHQTETFEVLEGEVLIQIGSEEILARPGKRYVAPPGVPHRMINHGSTDARLISGAYPALRMDELLETLWGLATDGRTNRWGHPSPLRAAAIAAEFRDEFRLTWPQWLQDAVFRPLLPLARALSYPGTYVPVDRRRLRPASAPRRR
ncbi:hypothetical protein GCM10011581_03110 [Saccharopolyspora subtropica]|uniref:Cupin type-2 domain-containing protein n=1 Tax=Saccharopolyspora thermophila TaxID=89367 RepID=A0A917N657_9PSEU|nr:cupin domain-containing protein [Saccharopolyspora subtropica]GGI69493.1 hypothetical protein GCM10011581_03110 [Saccharopolyspora subtropica]